MTAFAAHRSVSSRELFEAADRVRYQQTVITGRRHPDVHPELPATPGRWGVAASAGEGRV